MAWSPTTDQILNLDGVRRRSDRFRFELCDRDLRPIGEVHPDREKSVPTIQNDSSSNTSRRLSNFMLTANEAADVNTMSDRLRVYMVLQNDAEFLLGTFLWADENTPQRSWGLEHHSELSDFTYILDKQQTQTYGWETGATIVLIMLFLCFRAGFELKNITDIGPESHRALADAMSWQPGATWLQMLKDLGNLVGFTSPWCQSDGKLVFDQIPNPAFDHPRIPAYDGRIIADSILFSKDSLGAPNDFGVFDSGNDRLLAGRYELPASAPHSFQNRSFRIGSTESVQGMGSQAQADMSALQLARDSDVHEYVTFNSTLDPRHDSHEIIDVFGKRWLETSWSMELKSGGLMKHSLKRVHYDVV